MILRVLLTGLNYSEETWEIYKFL